jgi:alpha-amylase
VYADIVLNHNSGGQLESNPLQEPKRTTGVASGKFLEQVLTFIKIHTQTMMKVFWRVS